MSLETPRASQSRRRSHETAEILVSPSLMCADVCRLGEAVRALEELPADLLHFDLMDGHFVPNLPMGLGVLSALRDATSLPFDVHLMVENNDWFIGEVARTGAERIAVHAESAVHLDRSLALIRSHGIRAGVALNPATPLDALEYVLERLDFVLLMTVNPGFAGQELVPASLRKITDCRAFLDARGHKGRITVDGNVSFDNIPAMVEAGADVLVAGSSSLFRQGASLSENMDRLRQVVDDGLVRRGTAAATEDREKSTPPAAERGT